MGATSTASSLSSAPVSCLSPGSRYFILMRKEGLMSGIADRHHFLFQSLIHLLALPQNRLVEISLYRYRYQQLVSSLSFLFPATAAARVRIVCHNSRGSSFIGASAQQINARWSPLERNLIFRSLPSKPPVVEQLPTAPPCRPCQKSAAPASSLPAQKRRLMRH